MKRNTQSFGHQTGGEKMTEKTSSTVKETATFHGVQVDFPYTLYEAQKVYLDKLLFSLCNGENALLESPTGTGKTLCLLCGVLAWQAAVMKGSVPHPLQLPTRRKMPTVEEIDSQCLMNAETPTSDSAWNLLGSEKRSVGSVMKPWNAVESYKKSSPMASRRGHTEIKSEHSDPTYLESIPKIYFMSRTHAQLSQAISELKRTKYVSPGLTVYNGIAAPRENDSAKGIFHKRGELQDISGQDLRMTIVASRDHLCIHTDLMGLKGAARVAGCQQKLKLHTCHYEGGLSKFKLDSLSVPRDIEELRTFGIQSGLCPYYAAKDHIQDCHVVFLPYDYLLNASMRKQLRFQLKGAVLVFDEGHNMERAAEDAGSFDLSVSSIELCIKALSVFVLSNTFQQLHCWSSSDVIECLLKPMTTLCSYINSVSQSCLMELDESDNTCTYSKFRAFPARHLLTALERCEIVARQLSFYEAVCSKCCEWVLTNEEAVEALDDIAVQSTDGHGSVLVVVNKALEDLISCFSVLFNVRESQLPFYRTFVSETRRSDTGPSRQTMLHRTVSFWCFTAGCVLQELLEKEGVHCFIVTSGTLAPLSTYSSSLNGNCPITWTTLENVHVVPKDRVCVQVVSSHSTFPGPFRFVYQNKNNRQLLLALGHIVRDVCERVPGGVIVFFSSYSQLNLVVQCWSCSELWRSLTWLRDVITEPNEPSQEAFDTLIRRFRSASLPGMDGAKKRKALLLGVIRGRLSEGLNLEDDMCRCVVVVGVPYPTLTDPRLKLKQAVLDSLAVGNGSAWYLQQAARAVNQAAGRVIRHANDFGLILLVDERFATEQQYNHLSRWLLDSAALATSRVDYSSVLKNVETFFQRFSLTPVFPQQSTHVHSSTIPLKITKSTSTLPKRLPRRRPKLNHVPTVTSLPIDKRIKKATAPTPQIVTPLSSFLRSTTLLKATSTSLLENTSKESPPVLCGVCGKQFGEGDVFKRSLRCGHRACSSCWSVALRGKCCCPYCGEKTRNEHLLSIT